MKISFFEIAKWEADYLESKLSGHEMTFSPAVVNKDNLPLDRNCEILSIFVSSKICEGVLEQLPNLRMIATRTTGFDHIDLAAAKERGVIVCSVPSYGENTVAEFAFGLLLNLSRKILPAVELVKEKGLLRTEGLQGFDLMGKVMGIIGTGKIGRHAIKIANGFEMKVIAFDAFPDESLPDQLNFNYVTLEELLKSTDVISLHVPYLPSTHHLINQGNIHLIKKGAILINTARGAVVETTALIKALKEGILSGAGLDVLEEESALKNESQYLLEGNPAEEGLKTTLGNHVLIEMENVLVTPHNAFNTKEAVQRILDTTVENINDFISGQPKNIVEVKEGAAPTPPITPSTNPPPFP